MASFKNCKYQWQLQVTLKEYFDSLSLQTPEDFDKVADTILAACEDYQSLEKKKRTPHIDNLSAKLRLDVQNILSYIDAPNENISPDFVNENLHLFGLSDPISPEETFAAYQELAKDILNEIATDFKKVPQVTRNDLITKKYAQLEEKQKEQAELKALKAPKPGSDNSTHQLFLTTILGGPEKFNEVFVKLKAEPCISDCTSPSGNIEGVLTDEDGLRWSFDCKAQDDEKFAIFVRNYDIVRLNAQDPTKTIPATQLVMISVLPAHLLPKGHFQYTSSITTAMLLSRVQELAYISFCVALGKLNNIDEQRLSAKIDQLSQTREYPPRAQIRDIILGLGPQRPMPVIPNLLAGILEALYNPNSLENLVNNDDNDDNEARMFQLPPAILNGLRAHILRNRPAEEDQDEDQDQDQDLDQEVQLEHQLELQEQPLVAAVQEVNQVPVDVPNEVEPRRNPRRQSSTKRRRV